MTDEQFLDMVRKSIKEYAICNGCGSLLRNFHMLRICPACKSYNFVTDEETVITRTAELLQRKKEGKQTMPNYEF